MLKDSRSLTAVVQFIVMANRSSAYSPEDREKDLWKKKFGKLLTLLYPFGFFGGMFYCLLSIGKREKITSFRNIIVEDHASKVIFNSMKRTWGVLLEQEFVTSVSKRSGNLTCFFRNYSVLRSAYEAAGISHVTEFIRVFRIFHFYLIWQNWFAESTPATILLARTNDQKRLALGAVAEDFGIPVYSFTVDRVGLRNPLPFAIKAQFCWTARQVALSVKSNIPAVRMPVPLVNGMKLPVPGPNSQAGLARYGLLLNAKCYPDLVAEWIENLVQRHGIQKILVRPHPGYIIEKLNVLSHAVICDWHQPLGDYLDSLDLVFSLNSNALIDSLLHGVPVIYVDGLDLGEFDMHHYVADGLSFAYSPEDAFPQKANDFFASDKFQNMWNPGEFTSNPIEEQQLMLKLEGSPQC